MPFSRQDYEGVEVHVYKVGTAVHIPVLGLAPDPNYEGVEFHVRVCGGLVLGRQCGLV